MTARQKLAYFWYYNLLSPSSQVHPSDVKESVQETLNGGVRYGYIQRSNRKYYAVPVDLDTIAGEKDNDQEVETNREDSKDTGEMGDRCGRRRSRKRSCRSRSRRGSRRRCRR